MSFTQKCLAASFSLAQGQFDGGGNKLTVQGLRMSARVVVAGDADTGTMELSIWGMSLSHMDRLTILPNTPTAVGDNNVTLYVGENGTANHPIFSGTIYTAFCDAAAQPSVCFRVTVMSGHVEALRPVPAISHPGTSDVATVMGEIAKSMGKTLENSGVDVKLSNLYLPGTAKQQASALARHAGIRWGLDLDTLCIFPPGQARNIASTTISPSTGLVNYPSFTAYGLTLTTLFQSTLKFGSKITVQSQLKPACGDWVVLRIAYELDAQIPNGKWFAAIEAGRTNVGSN